MGMQKNWSQFIEVTNANRKSHSKAARYWNSVSFCSSLILIYLGALTTFFSLVDFISKYVVAAIATLVTLLSAVQAFLRAADRKQLRACSLAIYARKPKVLGSSPAATYM